MTVEINKNTANDRRGILSDAVRSRFSDDDSFAYVLDYDDDYVYYEIFGEDRTYNTYRLSYTITDVVNVVLGDDETRVRSVTEFIVLEDQETEIERSVGNAVTKFLSKHFGGSQDNKELVIKQFNDESMIAIEPLYIAPDEVDLHGDTIDREQTEMMVKSFNEANSQGIIQSSLFHSHKTNAFTINKAWVNPCQCSIGEHEVKEGQPLVEIQFKNEKAWNLRKEGKLMGLSIGAKAVPQEV